MAQETYSLPKYFRISRDVVAAIQKGKLPPQSLAPSENDIIEKYGVSNTTARKALLELEKAGWVTRVKGRGTFVQDRKVEHSVNRIFGFTKNILDAGRTPSTKLIGCRIRQCDHSMTINGRVFALKGPFCEIERLRFADGIPMMKETRFISLKLCPNIQQQNLETSLYELYEKHYGLQMTEMNQMLSAVLLEGDFLPVFRLESPVPAFRVEGVSFCGKDMILDMENAVYRGDMYRFSARAVK